MRIFAIILLVLQVVGFLISASSSLLERKDEQMTRADIKNPTTCNTNNIIANIRIVIPP